MFSRGDERFDLFVETVFGYKINFNLKDIVQRNDYVGKQEFRLNILSKEDLILLKAITGRDKDYEDIETILEIEKDVDWKLIVSEAINQTKNNSWILIDLEETLQNLKKKYFIKSDIFELIYEAQN